MTIAVSTTLVVAAHPCPESFGAAVRDRVLAGLARAGCPHELIDLHERHYDPFLPFPARDAELLADATSLVMVHPTWWTSQPAILLAWLGQAVEVGLPEVRSLVTVTTLGGSRLANFVGGESGARVVDRVIRSRCPRRPVHHRLALYGLDRSTARHREAFLDGVEQQIAGLVVR
ncbi:MAG TPA: NAD(P)H-dependent oxidoreductase [Ilumatobacteraceae bacterium]|nr:NAD(P)H-dependent oxidoreductase [Ilumatobacteraceae bacterium]